MVSQDHDGSLVGGVHSGHHVGDEVDEIAQNVQSGDRLFCCCGGVLLDVPFYFFKKLLFTICEFKLLLYIYISNNKNKDKMNLTKKSQKTLERLTAKSNDKGRMPKLTLVHELLNELNIEHKFYASSCTKTTSASGLRYSTGGGSRFYDGYKLSIELESTRIHMDTTDTYYSWNTCHYSRDILKLIKSLPK